MAAFKLELILSSGCRPMSRYVGSAISESGIIDNVGVAVGIGLPSLSIQKVISTSGSRSAILSFGSWHLRHLRPMSGVSKRMYMSKYTIYYFRIVICRHYGIARIVRPTPGLVEFHFRSRAMRVRRRVYCLSCETEFSTNCVLQGVKIFIGSVFIEKKTERRNLQRSPTCEC